MDLKKQSEIISCNHIKFLENKYKLYNDLEFKKKIVCNINYNDKINENRYLKSLFITKKDCFYKPLEDNERLWETNFKEVTVKNNLFNVSTRSKIIYDDNCP